MGGEVIVTASSGGRTFRVGTRSSRLAIIQTEIFLNAAARPDIAFEIVHIETTSDRRPNTPIPDLGQGAFVKEIQIALANGEIDFAVHSLKDLPTRLPPRPHTSGRHAAGRSTGRAGLTRRIYPRRTAPGRARGHRQRTPRRAGS